MLWDSQISFCCINQELNNLHYEDQEIPKTGKLSSCSSWRKELLPSALFMPLSNSLFSKRIQFLFYFYAFPITNIQSFFSFLQIQIKRTYQARIHSRKKKYSISETKQWMHWKIWFVWFDVEESLTIVYYLIFSWHHTLNSNKYIWKGFFNEIKPFDQQTESKMLS